MSGPVQTLNLDHFEAWLNEMATTDKPQATGKLCTVRFNRDGTRGPVGYCCLGLGSELVPDMPKSEPAASDIDWNDVEEETDEDFVDLSAHYGRAGVEDLAPLEFVAWLGLVPEEYGGESSFDLHPDWGEKVGKLLMQGNQRQAEMNSVTGVLTANTAASMNDDGFTFAQIADVFRYFGVKPIVEET